MDPQRIIEQARQALIGKDPHALEEHLQNGLLQWATIEHALWDIIGKEAGLPVHKLLGGFQKRLPIYLTCVWPGGDDQSQVAPQQVAEQAVAYMEKGFKAMKIRAWRPDPMGDVAAVRAVKEAVGDTSPARDTDHLHERGYLAGFHPVDVADEDWYEVEFPFGTSFR